MNVIDEAQMVVDVGDVILGTINFLVLCLSNIEKRQPVLLAWTFSNSKETEYIFIKDFSVRSVNFQNTEP